MLYEVITMFNIHASAGVVAMKTVMERLSSYEKRPLVLAVTALTSFDEENFQSVITSYSIHYTKLYDKVAYKPCLY